MSAVARCLQVMAAGAPVFDHFSKLGQAFIEQKEARKAVALKAAEEQRAKVAEERARLQAVAGKKAVVYKAAEIVKVKRELETAEAEIMQYAKDIITGHNHKIYSLARKLHMA